MPPPDGTIALEVLVMADKDEIKTLVDWERRPAALMRSGEAYAVLSKDSGWVSVNRSEVIDSGTPISPSNFSKAFPNSDLRNIPTSPPSEGKTATSDTTTTVPRAVALSSSKDEDNSPHEYLRTYKASEDRWTAEAMGRALVRFKAAKKAAKRKKKGKPRKDR